MSDSLDAKTFIKELAELLQKHNVSLSSCGCCCCAPYILDAGGNPMINELSIYLDGYYEYRDHITDVMIKEKIHD